MRKNGRTFVYICKRNEEISEYGEVIVSFDEMTQIRALLQGKTTGLEQEGLGLVLKTAYIMRCDRSVDIKEGDGVLLDTRENEPEYLVKAVSCYQKHIEAVIERRGN